jgi:indole-3-glycerol phosphate synthase
MFGINHRNLRTFKTTLEISDALVPQIPKSRPIVGESGISSPADIAHLVQLGISTVLVGESPMRQTDVTAATLALLKRDIPGLLELSKTRLKGNI